MLLLLCFDVKLETETKFLLKLIFLFIFYSKRDSLFFLRWCCMRYLSMVSVLPAVDGGRYAPGLEKQRVVPEQVLCQSLFPH